MRVSIPMTLAWAMAGAMGAAAQEPMATPSEEPELRTSPFPAEETAPPDRDQSVVFSPVAPRAAAEGSPFSWGPVAIRPYVSWPGQIRFSPAIMAKC